MLSKRLGKLHCPVYWKNAYVIDGSHQSKKLRIRGKALAKITLTLVYYLSDLFRNDIDAQTV